MKTVLVSGASGFLGKILVSRLSRVNLNIRVVALYRSAIPDSLRSVSNVEWVRIDLADPTSRLVIPYQIDVVVHLAGATLGAGKDPSLFFRSNEMVTFNLLNQLSGQCSNFIYASSQVVYGDVCSLDVSEELSLDVKESAYACSKVNCENWLRWFQKKTGGTYLSLRFCGFIDGGGLIDYILDMACEDKDIELFSSGEIVRDYLSSDDAIMALSNAINCIETLASEFIPINIGSGQLISSIEIAELVCIVTNSDSSIIKLDRKGPQGDFILNNTKARKLLNFQPHNLVEEINKYANNKSVTSED
jgi:nucleoside-diphosphate-sugar epimerase